MNLLRRLRQTLVGATAGGGETYRIRGFTVFVDNTRPDIETRAVLERLDESLALIEQAQPWRLAHMRRDVSRFLVIRYPCRGAFFPHTRECMTELTFLARRDISPAPVAASILHEGVHARVHGMGVRLRDRSHHSKSGPTQAAGGSTLSSWGTSTSCRPSSSP